MPQDISLGVPLFFLHRTYEPPVRVGERFLMNDFSAVRK